MSPLPLPRHALAGNGAGNPPRLILSRVLSARQRIGALYAAGGHRDNPQMYRFSKTVHTAAPHAVRCWLVDLGPPNRDESGWRVACVRLGKEGGSRSKRLCASWARFQRAGCMRGDGMQLVKLFVAAASVIALTAGVARGQTSTTLGTPGTSGTSGSVLRPSDPNRPPTTQSAPSTPNTAIGGSLTGGIPGTLGGTPYSAGGSVTGGIPGTLGGTPSGGGSSQSNTSIGGAGSSTTPATPSTIGGSSTGAIPGSSTGGLGSSSSPLGGTSSGSLGSGVTGTTTGTIR
jgi:hypothetical protein